MPVGVITGRRAPDGEPLEAVLITEHLQFSLPYRALFSQDLRPDTATRLIDALAVLLVRLHLVGFYWGDVSLSNTLFRRDAETFAAYLVDAETGDLHDTADRRPARLRPRGRARQHHRRAHGPPGGRAARRGRRRASPSATPSSSGTTSCGTPSPTPRRSTPATAGASPPASSGSTTSASTSASSTSPPTSTAPRSGSSPRSSTPGTTPAACMRLTGLDVQENQARRLLNDLDSYRAATDRQNDEEQFVAHDWLTQVFEPAVAPSRASCAASWSRRRCSTRSSTTAGSSRSRQSRDVPMPEAAESYVENVLGTGRTSTRCSARAGWRTPRTTSAPEPATARTGVQAGPDAALPRHLVQGDARPRHAAFSDSMADAIGIDAIASHCSRTRRDRPLPSEPTTSTSGSVAYGELADLDVAAAVEPDHEAAGRPSGSASARARFVARATGTRAAAPAETFHADAVTPAGAALGHQHAVRAERRRRTAARRRGCGGP